MTSSNLHISFGCQVERDYIQETYGSKYNVQGAVG